MTKGKMTRCTKCGKPFAAAVKNCPYCGAKNPLKKSSLPKIILSVIGVFLIIGVVGMMLGGGDDGGSQKKVGDVKADQKQSENDNGKNPSEADSSENDPENSPKNGDNLVADNGKSGALGGYYVEIKGATVANDYDGNPAIIITYSWTNNSEETTSAEVALMEKAFQNGVQLDTAIIGDPSIYDSELSFKDIRPGITLDVQCAYELSDETSLVEFELSEFISLSKDMVTANFDPANLE